jgi:UPF0755 protein
MRPLMNLQFPNPVRLRSRVARMVASVVLVLVLVLGLVLGYLWAWRSWHFSPSPVMVKVTVGAGPQAIAATLAEAGVPVQPWLLRLALRIQGGGALIRAGGYRLASPLTLRELVATLTRGEVIPSEVRIVEGWPFRQMRATIDRHPDLIHETQGWSEAQLLAAVGADRSRAEGLFWPDTYTFAPGTRDLDIYRQAHRRMAQALEQAWAARDPSLPLALPYDLLILASIVEKETGREEDRGKVAAVLVNRLRKPMYLQSDPTTIYGLGEAFDGNLRRSDLLSAANPWNTYAHPGLPPSPIALVGRASLQAASQPERISALYFVARGDGSSEFSEDLASHQRAVVRYQLGRR